MNLAKEINKAISDNAPLDRLETLNDKFKSRRAEALQRWKAITDKDTTVWGSSPGPERRRVMADCDVDAVVKLDDEQKQLEAEIKLLDAAGNRLRDALKSAQAEEAAKSLPDMYQAYCDSLAEEMRQTEALRKTRTSTEDRLAAIRKARKAVATSGRPVPSADAETLQQYLKARGIEWSEKHGFGANHRHVQQIADALGLEEVRPTPRAKVA